MTHAFDRIDRVGSSPQHLVARRQAPRPSDNDTRMGANPTTASPSSCPPTKNNPKYQSPKIVLEQDDVEPPIVTATPILPGTSCCSSGGFAVGEIVQLTGLKGAAHLNGAAAVVERDAPMAGGRIQVRLSDKEPGKLTCLKPENLVRVQTFQPGQMVALKGLEKKELNGVTGMVESCFPGGGRVQVCLYEGKSVSIKPENLEIVADILD